MPNEKYNLEERTTKFSKAVFELIRTVPQDRIIAPLISQLVNASTSVGANYCEADDAEFPRDFKHKIGICKKEAREAKYWLTLLASVFPEREDAMLELSREAQELNLIFNAINNKLKEKLRKK